MNIYDELDVIDEFEKVFGNREAVERSCDVMISYMEKLTAPLPGLVAQGLQVAAQYRRGLIGLKDLEDSINLVAKFLRENSAITNCDEAQYSYYQAINAILLICKNPAWGGGASELVSNFLSLMEKVEIDNLLFEGVIRKHFPH